MRITSYRKISKTDQLLLQMAKDAAGQSAPRGKRKVGCILLCGNGSVFTGATVLRARVIGSTCAERMALDKWYFSGTREIPTTCYLVGVFNRKNWNNDFICTPCGVCLEMFLELVADRKARKVKFICSNWKLNQVLSAGLDELFPQPGKGGWPYKKIVTS